MYLFPRSHSPSAQTLAYVHPCLFAEAVKRPEILSARAAFFVLHEWSAEARETAAALNAGGVPVVVFLTSGRTDAADDARALPRTEILPASPDEKLTEVM